MRAPSREELIRAVRDLALIDRHGQACGIVDDIEVAQIQPGIWELRALLVGAYRQRRPHWLTRLLPRKRVVRIAAADVASATSVVRLNKRADELGLAITERNMLAWVSGK
jgi:hypothetical protein